MAKIVRRQSNGARAFQTRQLSTLTKKSGSANSSGLLRAPRTLRLLERQAFNSLIFIVKIFRPRPGTRKSLKPVNHPSKFAKKIGGPAPRRPARPDALDFARTVMTAVRAPVERPWPGSGGQLSILASRQCKMVFRGLEKKRKSSGSSKLFFEIYIYLII
jgi:hypothetical protein